MFGHGLPLCTGSDLTSALLSRLAEKETSIAILGLDPGYLARFCGSYSKLVVHHYNPPMGFIQDASEVQKCLDFLHAHPADVVFFALGFPRQEQLAARFSNCPGARGVGLCIGASLDFIVGAQHRAPSWVQSSGLEWAYRLLQSPKRMARRYLIESPKVIYYLWQGRQKTRQSLLPPE
jgi:exopolysaccharide biosynthesis WecB/TagA/CpsF family protein